MQRAILQRFDILLTFRGLAFISLLLLRLHVLCGLLRGLGHRRLAAMNAPHLIELLRVALLFDHDGSVFFGGGLAS